MTVREFYDSINSDYDAVISRMINEAFVLKYLRRFPEDPHFAELENAVKEGDTDTAYRSVHTLKGLCLSLGFDRMSVPVIELTEELRAGKICNAQAYLETITPLYKNIVSLIAEL